MKDNIKIKDLKIFLFIWAVIFTVVAIFPIFLGGELRSWSLIIAFIFIFIMISKPILSIGFYKLWIKVGEFIGGIISRIMLFILYFVVFTPVALVLKLLGKDLLNKKLDKNSTSHWITRETQPQSMKNQF